MNQPAKSNSTAKNLIKELDIAIRESWDLTKEEWEVFKRIVLVKTWVIEKLFLNSQTARTEVMRNLWLEKDIITDMNEKIWDVSFEEPEDILIALKWFLLKNYKHFWVNIYKYDERTEISWNITRSLKVITDNPQTTWRHTDVIDSKNKDDFGLELASLKNDSLLISENKDSHWTIASVAIRYCLFDWIEEKYIISFKQKSPDLHKDELEKELKRLDILFKKTSLTQLLNEKFRSLKLFVDELTWLYNHKFIYVIKDRPYWVMVIDVDDFKKYNDTNWHYKWDLALQMLWRVFKSSIRLKDRPTRSGGDEFIIFVDCEDFEPGNVLEWMKKRILENLELENGFLPKEERIKVTIWYEPYDSNKSYEERLKNADFDMYKNKTKKWKRHRVASQYRDYIEDWTFMDNIKIMALLNKELLKHIFQKLFWKFFNK